MVHTVLNSGDSHLARCANMNSDATVDVSDISALVTAILSDNTLIATGSLSFAIGQGEPGIKEANIF